MSAAAGEIFRHVVRGTAVETRQYPWGQITWLDSAELTGSETLTVGLVYILPGQGNPEHYHPNCDEALVLLEGRLRHTLGEEVVELGPGDTIHVPKGLRHRAINIGHTPARMVVAFDTGRRQAVGVDGAEG